ncbi:MAG: methylmalonyl-CoA carboxyltransferase [Deltaproteobacteria bacterium]|nr:methylmalonyl-CoA carboxyltransferase [Deltaproteobacteria bacterium]
MAWKLRTLTHEEPAKPLPPPASVRTPAAIPAIPRPLTPAEPAQTGPSPAENIPARRLQTLFDDGRYEELDALVQHQARGWGMEGKRAHGDGVVVATGKIHGRPAVAFAQDRRFMGGSLGEAHARKICKGMDMAERIGAPIIGLLDSGGARIQEGVAALAGYGEIFRRNVKLSGRVPQFSVVLGPCAGGAVYSPSITDFIILSEADALMFVTGPKVVKQAMFEDIDGESLGGARVHSAKSGVAHLARPDEKGAIGVTRDILGYLVHQKIEAVEPATNIPLTQIVPENFRKPYDIRDVIAQIADRNTFLEIQPDYATSVVVGLARLAGRSVGIIANQPMVRAGVLDINSSRKAARFIRTMSCFGIPLVSLVDVPGFMPGSVQEHNGIITHGAKLLYAYVDARVPRLTVILRKAFGGAYIVMSSKHLGSEVNLAWPSAQISVMGAEGAVEILHGKEIKSAADPKARFEELCQKYREQYMSVGLAAERGWIDEVIQPNSTRHKMIHYLDILSASQGEPAPLHGNIPL